MMNKSFCMTAMKTCTNIDVIPLSSLPPRTLSVSMFYSERMTKAREQVIEMCSCSNQGLRDSEDHLPCTIAKISFSAITPATR